jgi:hypothetical protein
MTVPYVPPQNTTGHPGGVARFSKNVRRRPTLPRSLPRSTIGAEGLSFRVRNGAGRFPFAMAAETLWRYVIQACSASRSPHFGASAKAHNRSRPYLGNRTVDAGIFLLNREG